MPLQLKKDLILHSNRGSQYTSKAFVKYCQSIGVCQSMSKSGRLYDNAVRERYYNSLKCEWVNQHNYDTDEELNRSISEYAYLVYNHKRLHSYNQGCTPFEQRYLIN
jgi:Transposase and inactivated derivatives